MRTFKLISRFYFDGLFLVNFLITLSCIYLLQLYGAKAYEIIGILFWYKVITVGLVLSTAIHYQKNVLFYYQNLGITKMNLGVSTSLFDFALWLTIIVFQLSTGISGAILVVVLTPALAYHLYNYFRK